MKIIRVALTFISLFAVTAFGDSGVAVHQGLSLSAKIQMQNSLRTGSLGNRWTEGQYWVGTVSQEIFRFTQKNHEKEYQGFDPIGLFYSFSSRFSQPSTDFQSPHDPVAAVNSNISELINIIGPANFDIYNQENRDLFSDISKVLIGIYYEADLSKTVAIGRRTELDDLQTFIFEKVVPQLEVSNVDPSLSVTVLKYLRAKHFNFQPSAIYEVANSLQQTAYQSFAEDKDKSDCLQIAAANYLALTSISKTVDTIGLGVYDSNFWSIAGLSGGLALADAYNLQKIQRRLLPVAIKNAQDHGDWSRTAKLEDQLLTASQDEIRRRGLFDRFSIFVRKVELSSSEMVFYIVLTLFSVLLVVRSWSLGKEKTIAQKPAATLYQGFISLIKKCFSKEHSNLSALDRLIIALTAFGVGALPSLISKRADFIMDALIGK